MFCCKILSRLMGSEFNFELNPCSLYNDVNIHGSNDIPTGGINKQELGCVDIYRLFQ